MRTLILAMTAVGVFGFSTLYVAPARSEDKVVIKEHREHRDRDHFRIFDHFRHRDHDRSEIVIKKGDHRGHDHDHDHDHD